MAKSANQKLKLFYILRMLDENTDEDHVLSTQDIIDNLAKEDIKAERKSIYDDIRSLTDFGYDIIQKKGRTNSGYYLASRNFELAELKLLVDAVQASRFITIKKSRELIKKLEKLASKNQAVKLQRQVFVADRVKTENEKIYYSIDTIYTAIEENKKITFSYLKWTSEKILVDRREGEKYTVSPWALIWEDENYYLAAFDKDAQIIKHYRVDKMGDVCLAKESRDGKEQYEKLNLANYTKQTFGMYGGIEETVTLRFKEDLIGVMIDRFGKETDIRQLEGNNYSMRIKAVVSGQFYGWIVGLGPDVSIISPQTVKDGYKDWLQKIICSQM